MNKIQILEKLKNLELDKEKYIIISGASLVLQDIIENTPDIDLTTTIDYYNEIDWQTKIGAYNKEIKYKDCFEISNNLYDENEFIIIGGYKVSTIKKDLEIKKTLNREKDQKVIKILEDYLNNK